MAIEHWWPHLRVETQQWLTANNGDVVPPPLLAEIRSAGGPSAEDPWWVRDDDVAGPTMPDEAVDWIEEQANAEGAAD